MPTDAEYQRAIRRLDRAGLRNLWAEIETRNTPGWDSGKALEYLILRGFEIDRAEVKWPFNVASGGNTIEQIDGVAYVENVACLFECKDTNSPVNFEPIAKLRQQLSRRPPAAIGCVFSRSGFTDEALLLTERSAPQNVLLWYGDEIEYALGRDRGFTQGLIAKYRNSIERALPDFKINIT